MNGKEPSEGDEQCPLACAMLQHFIRLIQDPMTQTRSMYSIHVLHDHVIHEHKGHLASAGHRCLLNEKCPTLIKQIPETDHQSLWHRDFFHPPDPINIGPTQLTRDDTASTLPEPSVSPQAPQEITGHHVSLSSLRLECCDPAMGLSLQMTDSFIPESPECSLELQEEESNIWTEGSTERMFVSAFCRQTFAQHTHRDLKCIISSYLEPGKRCAAGTERGTHDDAEKKEGNDSNDDDVLFKYRLGLLEWRDYTDDTRRMVKDFYRDEMHCKAILDAVSRCVFTYQILLDDVVDDIYEPTSGSKLMSCIAESLWEFDYIQSPNGNQEKKRLQMLLQKVMERDRTPLNGESPSDDANSRFVFQSPPPINRPLSNLILETHPSPTTAMSFKRTTSSVLSLESSVSAISEDISKGFPGGGNNSGSFILSTMAKEHHETCCNDVDDEKIQNLQTQVLGLTQQKSKKIVDSLIELNVSIRGHGRERKYCPEALLDRGKADQMKRDYGKVKACEKANKMPFIMLLVNQYTEIRIAAHYIEVVKRKRRSTVDECEEIEYQVEPFGNNEAVYGIEEFLRTHPLTQKDSKMARSVRSVFHRLVTKLMRPLPLDPPFVIMDNLKDILSFSGQFAKFVRNRLMVSHGPVVDPDLLHLPIQMDFWIIPQSVGESEMQYSNSRRSKPQRTCTVPFNVENQIIGDIGDILRQIDAENENHISIAITDGHFKFSKKLVQTFAELRKKLPGDGRRRYIFILDRRNPQNRHSPNHQMNGRKSWTKLHIWCPSGPQYEQFAKLPSSSDLFPEVLIDRTMECMLPLVNGQRIGAKHQCNGYMFATSYHLFEADKVKTYFLSNGYCQRFTQNEYQYYWPRLFMKVDGKFQDERWRADTMMDHRRDLDDFFERSEDREHLRFKKYTMNQLINAENTGR